MEDNTFFMPFRSVAITTCSLLSRCWINEKTHRVITTTCEVTDISMVNSVEHRF